MANVDTIDITKLILVEQGSTPSNPASGKDKLFVRSSDHLLCLLNSSGTVTPYGGALTNPMSAVGDLIQGTTAGAPARLAAPAAGEVLTSAGATTPLVYAYPPGYELDYAQVTTATTNITATTEAGADTLVAGNAVSYDGSTAVMIEFYTGEAAPRNASNGWIRFVLYDGAGSIGYFGMVFNNSYTPGTSARWPVVLKRKITPSNASHTYSVKAYVDGGTGAVSAGSGSAAGYQPMYIRITKA